MHPELLSEFPRLQSLDAFPCNLPAQISSFVGRDDDVAEVARALGEWRLLTLTGVGGVGKTRLAIQVAAEVLPGFPDGAWLCELAVASEPEAMLQVIATALGVQARPGVATGDRINEFLRTKRLLVVLDNCEHLLDAAARFADALLRDAPQVCILATSREGLAVDGEHMRALRSLSVPDPSADIEALSGVMRADCSSTARRRWTLPSCWMQPPAPQWGSCADGSMAFRSRSSLPQLESSP